MSSGTTLAESGASDDSYLVVIDMDRLMDRLGNGTELADEGIATVLLDSLGFTREPDGRWRATR